MKKPNPFAAKPGKAMPKAMPVKGKPKGKGC